MKNLKDKIAVVTGAGSGIGRALSLELAGCGCKLAICDWNDNALEETRKALAAQGATVIATPFDVSNLEDMKTFAGEVMEVFGQVDIVVNNAGITLMQQPVEKTDYADFDRVWKVNYQGVLYGTKEFLPQLKTRPEAALVNVASIFSARAFPYQAPYVAAKFAVRGLTETLRQELTNSKVTVTVVMPGGIKTNIVNNIDAGDVAAKEKFARVFDRSAVTTAGQAAKCIVDGIRHKKARVLIGNDARVMDLLVRIFPHRYEKVIQRLFAK